MTANTVTTVQPAALLSHRARSNWIFAGLILLSALLSGLSLYLPQGFASGTMPAETMPQGTTPQWIMALAAFGIVALAYGALGAFGLSLTRKLGLPDLVDPAVTDRQRYLVPLFAGVGLAVVLIIFDLIFAQFNGIGRFPHPQFPTSIVASFTAGVNEEIMFRLFYIGFFTWLVARIFLRTRNPQSRAQNIVYWVVSVFAAIAFAAGHLPSVMFMIGSMDIAAIPTGLLIEIFLLNGVLGLVFAYLLKRFGFLAAAGAHFWTDIVWHVIWGLVG